MEKSIIWPGSGKSEAGQRDCLPSLTECKLLFQIKNLSLNHFSMHKCPAFSIINNGRWWVHGRRRGRRSPSATTTYKIMILLPAFRTFSLVSLNNTIFHPNSSFSLVWNIFFIEIKSSYERALLLTVRQTCFPSDDMNPHHDFTDFLMAIVQPSSIAIYAGYLF